MFKQDTKLVPKSQDLTYVKFYQNLNLGLIFLQFSKNYIFKTKKDTDFSFVAF